MNQAYIGQGDDLAKKLSTQKAFCPNCEREFTNVTGYYQSCGTESRVADGLASEANLRSRNEYDLPMRASFFFWFDRLIFTRFWYVPVLLILSTASAALLASPDVDLDPVLILLVTAVIAVFVLLIAWKNRNH